jgi:general stress protein 26
VIHLEMGLFVMDGLKQKVNELMEHHGVGTLATIRDSKPYTRFMDFIHDDLTLYTATNRNTHKVEDILRNPFVHILIGNEDNSWHQSYLEIEARAELTDDPTLKQRCWDDHLKEWLQGPDDPNYVVLKLNAEKILLFDEAGTNPEELTI